MLDKQELTSNRQGDLQVISEDEYQKVMIFFANCKCEIAAAQLHFAGTILSDKEFTGGGIGLKLWSVIGVMLIGEFVNIVT